MAPRCSSIPHNFLVIWLADVYYYLCKKPRERKIFSLFESFNVIIIICGHSVVYSSSLLPFSLILIYFNFKCFFIYYLLIIIIILRLINYKYY